MPIAKFINKFDKIEEYVLTTPVAITVDGRIKFVVISPEEYQRLVRLDAEDTTYSP